MTNSNQIYPTNGTNQTIQINEKILNKFINELNDYEEFLLILKNMKKV